MDILSYYLPKSLYMDTEEYLGIRQGNVWCWKNMRGHIWRLFNRPNFILTTPDHLEISIYNNGLQLYIESHSKFILQQMNPGTIRVIGKLSNNKIIPLTGTDEIIANKIGLDTDRFNWLKWLNT